MTKPRIDSGYRKRDFNTMPVDLLMFAKTLGRRFLSFAGLWIRDGFAKWRARSRAIRGENLSGEISLEYMVRVELSKLAVSSALPTGLQSDAAREWLTSNVCTERFVETLIADAGGDPALAKRARDELAALYERATGETQKLATGPLNLVVDYVSGQLRATEAARHAFDSALHLRVAAQLHALRYPDLRPFPTDSDLERLHLLSGRLLAAGRVTWKMPEFIAPLTLEVYEEREDKKIHPISTTQLVEAIEAGGSVILFGDGGIGKTTLLLELASSCTREAGRRTPLYVDAAIWARSGVGVLDYLASTPPAQALSVTSGELSKLAEGGFLVLMVNGWNEIPAERKAYCRETFNILASSAPALAVALTSRTVHDAASLRSPRKIAVRGLNWQGQSSVIDFELKEEAAVEILDCLVKDTRLRHAARSPMILRGLIAQAHTGAKFSANVYDILGAVVASFEREDKRGLLLNESPVFGMQARYLEELACCLNIRATTNLPREEALSAIGAAASHMVTERLLGTVPQPAAVLEILASHHVLHVQDGLVRFAHQRFQEYFAATRLLRIIGQAGESVKLLSDAVNEPAWADSLELVAGKIRNPDGTSIVRARLVQTAEAVDLSYACDLAGLCAFADSDDPALHLRLVSRVNELIASPLKEVMELGIACQISSRLPAFADSLWTRFESDDQQTRFHSHRLNGSAVSLTQLGPHAEERVKAWSSERRSEFVYEVASNPSNYEFIVDVAATDTNPDVQAAALSALFSNYPASTVGINTWLKSSIEVQTKYDFLNYIHDAQEQGIVSDQINEQLRVIAASEISDNVRLQLALAFPAEAGPTAVDIVFARLRNEERHNNPDPLISIAKMCAPDRLRALAIELAAGPRGAPQWVGRLLLDETPDVHEEAFERAWVALQTGEVRHLSPEIVGPLSTIYQTRRSIVDWLRYCLGRPNKRSDTEHERGREIGYLLAHAPGDLIFNVLMELGATASYEESVVLAEMLLNRVSRGEGQVSNANPWSLKPEKFRELFALFSIKPEQAENPQDSLFVFLACIASHVAPAEFGQLILEAFRRHLDAWTAYRAQLDKWQMNQNTPRPNNPSLGNHIIEALARWGLDALPSVLTFVSHQCASEIVPQAIIRIASLPWTNIRKELFNSVNTDIQEGRRRRDAGLVLQQPSSLYQSTTDEAARALVGLLNVEFDQQLRERETNPKWNAKQAEYRIGRLVRILANVPSVEIVAPVTRTLSSGLLGIHGFVDVVKSLIRQGWIFSHASAVSEFEALYERETSPTWIHESARYTLAEFSQLMLVVEPPTLLKLPISHYLSQWRRFASISQVIRALGDMNNERAWPLLLSLGTEMLAERKEPPEHFVFALVSALLPNHFAEFTRLVENGTLFLWCRNVWTMEQVALAVVGVVKESPDHLILLIDSWRKNASPLADALLGKVLSELGGEDEKCIEFGLEALDAGRAYQADMPAYRMLKAMFTLNVPLDGNLSEIYPKACNPLRQQLYSRAKAAGDAAIAARRILATLECSRREGERPIEEFRHPEPKDGFPWTRALASVEKV